MQKCQNCSKQFTWKDIIKSVFLGYKPIKCGRCNRTHNINLMTRIGYVSFAIAIPLVLFLTGVINFKRYNTIAYLIWAALITCITPFFARYHIIPEAKEETKIQR